MFGLADTHNLSDYPVFVPTPKPQKGRIKEKNLIPLATPN